MCEETKKYFGLSKRDWIMLLIPILVNGILIFCFQTFVSDKVTDKNRDDALQYSVYEEFWNKTRNFNNIIIEANVQTQMEGNLSASLISIKEEMIGLVLYYDTNVHDLKVFEKEFYSLTSSWDEFVETLQIAQDGITEKETKQLGASLEDVKTNNLELVDTIRKEMRKK